MAASDRPGRQSVKAGNVRVKFISFVFPAESFERWNFSGAHHAEKKMSGWLRYCGSPVFVFSTIDGQGMLHPSQQLAVMKRYIIRCLNNLGQDGYDNAGWLVYWVVVLAKRDIRLLPGRVWVGAWFSGGVDDDVMP